MPGTHDLKPLLHSIKYDKVFSWHQQKKLGIIGYLCLFHHAYHPTDNAFRAILQHNHYSPHVPRKGIQTGSAPTGTQTACETRHATAGEPVGRGPGQAEGGPGLHDGPLRGGAEEAHPQPRLGALAAHAAHPGPSSPPPFAFTHYTLPSSHFETRPVGNPDDRP